MGVGFQLKKISNKVCKNFYVKYLLSKFLVNFYKISEYSAVKCLQVIISRGCSCIRINRFNKLRISNGYSLLPKKTKRKMLTFE